MAVAAMVAASGCSLGGDEEPQGAAGAPAQIGEVVARLERAAVAGEFALICDQILSEAARRRAGGADCPRLTRAATEGTERPSIEIRAIEVRGGRATVQVRSLAQDRAPVSEQLELVTENGDWRVEALAPGPGR